MFLDWKVILFTSFVQTLIYRFNELHGVICQADSKIYLEMKRT